MNKNTILQYDKVIEDCRDIFLKKTKDYGTSWRVLRPSSLTDQLFIKAQRIRTIEAGEIQKVDEDVDVEFKGLINYCIIGLIQLKLGTSNHVDFSPEHALEEYNQFVEETEQLMIDKNHDYGEAWRDMRVSSMIDLILMKIMRIKQIEDNLGKTIISEGIDSHYKDIINYSIFALIKLEEV